MVWANFLHIYQPPTQKQFWIDKVTRESYRPLFAGLLEIPKAKVTLNINAVLAELLLRFGHTDVIDTIRQLARNGQLEFTASAKYHPLLPRIPKEEVVRQINLNEETNRKIFGEVYQPKGFFPPEMAFSVEVAGIVRELGYQWIICDELSFPRGDRGNKGDEGNKGVREGVDYSKLYTISNLENFLIFFRERATSNKILSFQLAEADLIIKDLGERLGRDEYLLTAMDGETFGHHRLGLEQVLFDLYKSDQLPSVLISELPAHFHNVQVITPKPSTWALMEKDLEQNVPFSRWDDKDNEIHHMQWELLHLAVDAVHREEKLPTDMSHSIYVSNETYGNGNSEPSKARLLLDQAIHSDQFWWAGAKPWWSIEYIEGGAKELKDAVFACKNVSQEQKNKVQELYYNILTTAFAWQRSGKVDKLASEEDEEIRQRVDRALPSMKDHEFEAMIASLETQKAKAAEIQEYERAAQFRDRIAELKEQWAKRNNA